MLKFSYLLVACTSALSTIVQADVTMTTEGKMIRAECITRANIVAGVIQRHNLGVPKEQTNTIVEIAMSNSRIEPLYLAVNNKAANAWGHQLVNKVYAGLRDSNNNASDIEDAYTSACMDNSEKFINPSIIDWKKTKEYAINDEKARQEQAKSNPVVEKFPKEIDAMINQEVDYGKKCKLLRAVTKTPEPYYNDQLYDCKLQDEMKAKLDALGYSNYIEDNGTEDWYRKVEPAKVTSP